MIILGTNSIKDTGFNVPNSLRFNRGSSDNLTRTPSSASNRRTFTLSFWVKRADLGSGNRCPFSIGNNSSSGTSDANWFVLMFHGSTNTLRLVQYNNQLFNTNRVFRDPSAWMHIVLAVDTTQGTDTNRMKVYVNGVQETSFSTINYPSENYDFVVNTAVPHMIGREDGNAGVYFSGYLSEYCFIDGSQLAADQFGEFDEDSGIWKPIDVSGLTFGTNGFYLQFKGSGTSANSSGLGADTSGNDLHFTVNNLTAVDQSTDTCTNNFCTINALDNFYEAGTLAEGNLKYTANTGRSTYITSTFGVSTGRWYYEVLCSTEGSNSYKTVGFTPTPSTATNNWFGEDADHVSYYNSGKIFNNGSGTNYGNSWSANDILGCYLDLTSNKAYFSKNGVLQNSGTGYDISGAAFQTNDFWFFTVGMPAAQSPGTVLETNFGSPPFAISSGNTDDNGYGNFEYSPNITGDGAAKSFYALCTKNLAEYG